MSGAAAGGVILFILISLWTVIWVLIYSRKEWPQESCTKIAAWFRPVQGCEGDSSTDYTTPVKLRIPIAFLVISFALKIAAVAYDRWDKGGVIWFTFLGNVTVYTYLGVIGTHVEISGDPSLVPVWQQSSQMYSSLCSDDGVDTSTCNVLQLGGILTLASSLVSLMLHVSIFVHSIMFLRNPACMPQYVYRVWWQAAMMVLATMNACNYHGGVTHIAGQDVINTGTGVGVSWYLMVASFVIDVVTRYFYRFATNSTKKWDGASITSASPVSAVAAEDVHVEVRDPNSRMMHPTPAAGPNSQVYPASSSASPPAASSQSSPGFFSRMFGGGNSAAAPAAAAPRASVAASSAPAPSAPGGAQPVNDPFNIYSGEQGEVASGAAPSQPRRSAAGAYGQSDGFFTSYQPPAARPPPMYEDDAL